MRRSWSAASIVVLAILTALTTVLTVVAKVPVPRTGGYYHLGDTGVYFAAFAFGPIFGALAGGLGTCLADLLSGYALYAPTSLIVHGLQGLVAGYIGYRAAAARQVLGWLVGSLIMIAGYFLAELLLYRLGAGAALSEVPGNAIQAGAGGLIAIPLVAAIRRVWPPIDTLGQPRTWEER